MIRSASDDRQAAGRVIGYFVDQTAKRWFAAADLASSAAVYASALHTRYSALVDRVFDHCESPIERAFFLSVVALGVWRLGPFGCQLHSPSNSTMIRAHHADLRRWERTLEEFLQLPDHDELMREAARQSDTEARSAAKDYLSDVVLGGRYGIHVAVQPAFTDEHIRPDSVVYSQRSDRLWVVECDGFDYHSDRAKFASDRSRDRMLVSLGYTPIRFAGSEIHADPLRCANELISAVTATDDVTRKEN
jgi:very-short-patch-repair endonuclease